MASCPRSSWAAADAPFRHRIFFFGRHPQRTYPRAAYMNAVKRFLGWAENSGSELPVDFAVEGWQYLTLGRRTETSVSARKERLAAILHFFDAPGRHDLRRGSTRPSPFGVNAIRLGGRFWLGVCSGPRQPCATARSSPPWSTRSPGWAPSPVSGAAAAMTPAISGRSTSRRRAASRARSRRREPRADAEAASRRRPSVCFPAPVGAGALKSRVS